MKTDQKRSEMSKLAEAGYTLADLVLHIRKLKIRMKPTHCS